MRKYLFLLFIIIVGFSVEDVQKEHIVLNWEVKETALDRNHISFVNATFSDSNPAIPLYTKIIDLKGYNSDIKYVLENQVFEEIDIPENFETNLEEEVQIESVKAVSGKTGKIHLQITPLKKVDNKIYALKSFDLKLFQSKTSATLKQNIEWKSNSVLSSGKWIKIRISGTGIYKIPHSKLSDWGFANPQQVNVYGSGGTILSEDPGIINYDDLIQNTVWHGVNNGADCLFFCARGILDWKYDAESGTFKHERNHFSNDAFYFLSEEGGVKNLSALSQISEPPTNQVNAFDYYELHEKELENVLLHGSGRRWFGERFRNNALQNISFDLNNIDESENVLMRIVAIGRSSGNSDMGVVVNQKSTGNISFSRVKTDSETDYYANERESSFSIDENGSQLEIQLEYKASVQDNNALAWLDFIELNYRRGLRVGNGPLYFRDKNSVGIGNIAEFAIEGTSSTTKVLDVTDIYDIKEIPLSLSGSVARFKRPADQLKEYVVFNTNGELPEPELIGEIENQNLHSLSTPEYIIITHPDFLNSADKLAEFHRVYDGMDVEVVIADEIYNEFSSGVKNATGIRNFVKMLYDKGQALKYVLLFGDGSYDNRNIKSGNNNFIPTFQTENSLKPTASFVTDDYFVMLDEGESVINGAIDLGIGRIPSSTGYEAELIVNKILNYYSPKSFGAWKNVVCFIGDDEDTNLHMKQSEQLADMVNANHNEFITDKIYLDAYLQEVTPAGENYPGVTESINNRVKDGVLILNYVGHANNRFMAHERVLDISDVNTWSNEDNLPIFVTATCEFSRFDAEETSIGEYVLFNPYGGGIALFSTTRVVYAGPNFLLSKSFYEHVFEKDETGERYRMGDIMRLAKINTVNTTNKRNFSLLGDPALKLSYPANKVVTTFVNGRDANGIPDTIGALQKIDIEGYISDFSDNKLNDFNGEITLTIYDKEVVMKTLGNGGETPMSFKVRENVIYKGLASVTNGNFNFSFVVPKDISYQLGEGKIIYYANDESRDAGGAFENLIIGGSGGNSIADNKGPDIQLYMDSPSFINGDVTSKSPTLLAFLSDENGINTVGSGIGHDITAVLDNDYSNVLVLNDYYQASINDYTSGTINFPMKDLDVGMHKLKLKAWDVANNSSEVEIEFEVSGEFQINLISNYPNPVNDYTFFTIEHNQAGAILDAVIEIFDQNGRRIDIIKTTVGSNGKISNPVRWDMNENGIQLRSGLYVYRIFAQNRDGIIASKSGKMMIFR